MTYDAIFVVLATLFIIAGFACASQRRLRGLVSLGNVLLLCHAVMIGSVALFVVNAVLLALNVARMRKAAGRRPTRTASDMDHDVHERIRAISAESRYSSAGYEF